ncbi:hypothetical protein M3Y99_01143000 [Aphelenchoides fujianensis]|nr:hypothetical protein M3Y99_01143000 [Aphelenchoides fujianensis]
MSGPAGEGAKVDGGESSRSSSTASNPSATVFNNVTYLGSATVREPQDEKEVSLIIAQLNQEVQEGAMSVKIEVPAFYMGSIRLFDGEAEIRKFPIAQIRCCTCGLKGTKQQECIAFSFTQKIRTADQSHQCHVFRCQSPQIVGHMLQCFQRVFESSCPTAAGTSVSEDHEFEMRLEIREDDDVQNGYAYCPVETNCFKLRKDRQRRIVAVVEHVGGPRELHVRNVFGVLLAAGRYLRESDMQLLDRHQFKRIDDTRAYEIHASWNPRARGFEVLNIETPKETRAFMTIAVDMILDGVDESVRFNVECRARICHQMESFVQVERVPVTERFFLKLLVTDGKAKITSVQSAAQRLRSLDNTANGKPMEKMPVQLIQPINDDESDSDEPLLSGSGAVNRESDEGVLDEWRALIERWKTDITGRPPELQSLLQNGVPDQLRRDVWTLLSNCDDDSLTANYHSLLEKDCVCEQSIRRDIHRTFPAHDFFKETNGKGQEALYKICKAYSLYDAEILYCQGISFLAAALLLHMEEEKAFSCLVKIMFDYELRSLFMQGFETLHLRLFQLEKLIQDYIPNLFLHFQDNNIEVHMFASQWFLTLFTAKFPLQMVFFIIDLFLSEGINTIFHVALALLQDSKSDLLMLDFEGILKYFRVTLPRKYRTEAAARALINEAVKLKISHKRLAHYETAYRNAKRIEMESTDPLERLKRECAAKDANILRLERENDDMARELVTSKIDLRHRLDETEDKLENAILREQKRINECRDLEDEISVLREQSVMLKETCTSELDRLQGVCDRYEKVCSFYEVDRQELRRKTAALFAKQSACPNCSKNAVDLGTFLTQIELPQSSVENGGHVANGGRKAAAEPSKVMGENAVNFLINLISDYERSLKHVESELVETKLALVESQCQNQGLVHQMSKPTGGENAWLRKTLSSIREVGQSIKNNSAMQTNAAASTPSSDASFPAIGGRPSARSNGCFSTPSIAPFTQHSCSSFLLPLPSFVFLPFFRFLAAFPILLCVLLRAIHPFSCPFRSLPSAIMR